MAPEKLPLRCLWLTREFPYPADSGDVIYSGGLIQSLSQAGADVTVLCRERLEALKDGAPPVGARWHVVRSDLNSPVSSLLSSLPSLPHRYATKAFRSALSKLAHGGDWDVVCIDHLGMAWAVDLLMGAFSRKRRRLPVLVYLSQNHEETVRLRMAQNYHGTLLKRAALYLDALKSTRLERALVALADLVTVVTPEDEGLFSQNHPQRAYLCLTPGYSGEVLPVRAITQDSPRRVVILGSFDWLANPIELCDFLEIADPMFAAAGAEIQVVGRAPSPFLAGLRPRLRATTLVGGVKSVTPYLRGARMGIVHERTGGGFKLKLLDYVFNRVPIAAVKGSVGGLPLEAGDDILVYPDMATLSRGVLSVLDDIERLNELQNRAFTECLENLDWSSRGRSLLRELHRIHAEKSPPAQ